MSASTNLLSQDDTCFFLDGKVYFFNNTSELFVFLEKNRTNAEVLSLFALHCVQYNDLKNIVYLHTNGYADLFSPLTEIILLESAKYGKWKIIRYFYQNGVSLESAICKQALYRAMMFNQVKVLEYFHQQGLSFTNDLVAHLGTLCAFYGSLDCFKYLCENGLLLINELHMNCLLKTAAFKNNFHIFDYTYAVGININGNLSREIFNEQQKNKNNELILYYGNKNCSFIPPDYQKTFTGFSKKLHDFLEKNKENTELLLSFALDCVQSDDLKSIIYLHSNKYVDIFSPLTETILLEASKYGKWKIIRYYFQNGISLELPIWKQALSRAVMSDQRKLLEYLHQQGLNFTEVLRDYLGTLCALYGSLNCLKYLCENGLLLINEFQMDLPIKLATSSYHFHILDYLYTSGIDVNGALSRKIFNEQKENENHRIISYYASKSCSFIPLDYPQSFTSSSKKESLFSIKKKCILFDDNIDFIFENLKSLKQSDIEAIYYCAVANGYFNLFYFLRSYFKNYCNDEKVAIKAFELALVNNRSDIIASFMLNNAPFLQNRIIVKRLTKSAAIFCEIPIIDMLLSYYKDSKINITILLLYFAATNKRLDIIRYFNEMKGMSLEIFRRFNTAGIPDGEIRRFLADREVLNELKGDLTLIHQMKDELLKDDDIFHPSHFWDFFNKINIHHLKTAGFKNFKRNVNQNYFNFIPNIIGDTFFYSILFLNIFDFMKFLKQYQITDPDIIQSTGKVKEVYRRIFQKNRKLKLFLYRFTVGGLWDYVSKRDPENLLQRLEEPRVGNPIEIQTKDKLISQDLANSVQEYYFVKPYLKNINASPLKIVEIGAGYGRLGYVFLSALKEAKYIIFDIPPALYIAQKYLSDVFPDKKVFNFRPINSFKEIEEELERSDIAFFTINQIKYFPKDYANLCINISSLHEMKADQINKITELMSTITKNIIYIKQYKKYKNPFDNLIMKEKHYQFENSWKCIQRRLTPTNVRFFEKIFQKD